MSANQVFLLILLVSTIASFWLHLASIKWGFRWAEVGRISWLKAFGLMILFSITVTLVATIVDAVFGTTLDISTSRLAGFTLIGLQYIVACILVMIIYKLRFGRAAKAVAPYVATSLILAVIATFVIRTLAYEPYVIPTNSMAPTLLGEYLKATCPNCGAPLFGSPPSPRSMTPPEAVRMICSKELQTVLVKDAPKERYEGDRITVCKLLEPKRWDLVVFHPPQDPSVVYAKRLIGLPGEKLAIHDGAVWINDEKIEPPEPTRSIRYSPTVELNGVKMSGPGSVPVTLGPDEYFVLGDFVDAAFDSRFWEQGAPGHPPYAVPASYIVGVVINVYWPPDRWTSFR